MQGLSSTDNTRRFGENTAAIAVHGSRQKTNNNASYDAVFQSAQARLGTGSKNHATKTNFETLCQENLMRHFGSCTGKTYYHVMDASSISQQNWLHEDFPFNKFFSDSVDDSVLDWKPTREHPSQLTPDIQTKLSGTPGKHAIVVPPALDEKMKQDPALREQVAKNIDRIYTFHTSGGPRLPFPGTKFYGTRIYSSVVVLNENGEVEHCRVSGGGMIGPDEETMRQIEREQKRQAKRKAENERLNAEAAAEYWAERRELLKNDAGSAASARPL